MGAGNIKLVYARWADLSHAPFRLLAYMALVSRDEDDPPCFWGGRETLALGLGRLVDMDGTEAARKSAFRAVERNVSHLVKAGAVLTGPSPRPGRAATYILDLDRERPTLSVGRIEDSGEPPESLASETPDAERGPTPDAECRRRPTLSVATPDAERGPEEEEDERRTNEGRISRPLAEAFPEGPVGVANSSEDKQEQAYQHALAVLRNQPDYGQRLTERAYAELDASATARDIVIEAARLADEGSDAA